MKFTAAASGKPDTISSGIPLAKLNGYHRTIDVNFDHSTPVNVQNVQARVYDRVNIDNPASGVNTKVAEIVNFNGLSYSAWLGTPGDANVAGDGVGGTPHGSGDHVWWGEAWPSSQVSQYYYDNSSGVRFTNASTSDSVVNGDSRLGNVSGDDDTVGGSGIVVPLLNSPGSGQRFLSDEYGGNSTTLKPKWLQYYNSASADLPNIGANTATGTYGGSGVDTRHTWRLALSSTPLTIGSKNYSLYVSLEYL